LQKLSEICLHNSSNLLLALKAAYRLGIGAFRIMSPLFPRMTHPQAGYSLDDLAECETIGSTLEVCRFFAATQRIRLSFHPDQFVVLSSPHPAIVENSILELEYQGRLAEMVGADVINIHAGGVYGEKAAALRRFCDIFPGLPDFVKSRLTLENDDVSYTVRNLLSVCEKLTIPLVYDVHHHRCNPDGLSVEEATDLAGETWHRAGGDQYCHISSPRAGWEGGNPRPHADYIDPADFPECWRGREMTVDIEAKAKELAVVQLMADLGKGGGAMKKLVEST
jgi:UV DNA damage endonuclease